MPLFAKEVPKHAMFNARIETIDKSGAFREGFKSRGCLVPADGYFEWTVNAEDGKKDPWLLQMEGGEGFSFAGIWAHNDSLASPVARSSPRRPCQRSSISIPACRSSTRRHTNAGYPAKIKATMPRRYCWVARSIANCSSTVSAAT